MLFAIAKRAQCISGEKRGARIFSFFYTDREQLDGVNLDWDAG